MDLTQFLQKADSIPPKTFLPFSLLGGGVPQGGLVELCGALGGGKLEALLRFLRENPALQVAWLEEGMSTYPCALPQQGVSLERVLFVNAEAAHPEQASSLLDCAHLVLKTQLFGALILMTQPKVGPQTRSLYSPHTTAQASAFSGSRTEEQRPEFSETELRRLQIAAEKSGTTVFLIRERPSVANTWPLSVQLQVSRNPLGGALQIQVLKYRGQSYGKSQVTPDGADSLALRFVAS